MEMDTKVVTFGEVMMRLIPPGFLRFVQTRSFDVIYAGAEANVAIALANLNIPVDFVTILPENELGDGILKACALQDRGDRCEIENLLHQFPLPVML